MREQSEEREGASLIPQAITRVLSESSVAALATIVEGPAGTVGAKLLVEAKGARTGSLNDSELDEAVARHAPLFLASRVEAKTFKAEEFAGVNPERRTIRVLFERIEPEPRLVICGAGHVGAALARIARAVGYRTILIDDRADFLTRERFPDEGIELRIARTWTTAVAEAVGQGRGVSVAVVTRGHNEDEE
jgi:xanthine dehydrogenase accessory factor